MGHHQDFHHLTIGRRRSPGIALGRTNFEQTLPEPPRHQAKQAVREEYSFDFLELGEEHSKRELERAIIGRSGRFLREALNTDAPTGRWYPQVGLRRLFHFRRTTAILGCDTMSHS